MKIICYIFFLFFLIDSCEKNDNIKINKTNMPIGLTKNGVESIFDTIQITSLPYGSVILIDHFGKTGSDFEVTRAENNLLENEDSKFLSFYQNIFKINKVPAEKFYKYSNKNIIDFGLGFVTPADSISTYQGYYVLAKRLPNVGRNKVLIFNSIENKKSRNNIINNVDLVVLNNNNNQVIDNLNLSYSLRIKDEKYNNKYDDFDKYFYIDKNYIIHIKYVTGWEDTMRRIFAYVKYKIQKDGSIVRYFEQGNGTYKSEVEEGMIKNHLKEGVWKEAGTYFEKMYYINKYKAGIQKGNTKLYLKHIDSESVYTIDRNNYEIIDQDFKMR